MMFGMPTRWRSSFWRQPDPFEPTSLFALASQSPLKLILYYTYHFINYLRSRPLPTEPSVKIVCISDTHNLLPQDVPLGQILIHAGDLTVDGSIQEIQEQVDWMASLPHEEVVVIAGNHDTFLDPRTRSSLKSDQREGHINWGRVHYLQHRQLTLTIAVEPEDKQTTSQTPLLRQDLKKRCVTLFGAPQIPACGPMEVFAFQYARGQDAWSETVPDELDVLITHTPSKYHLDLPLPEGLGCEYLAKEVKRVRPKLHIFGHVHWGAGEEIVTWDECHDAFERGMGLKAGWLGSLLSPFLWLSVIQITYRGLKALAWDKIWGGRKPQTITINASQMQGNTGRLGNPVQTVVI